MKLVLRAINYQEILIKTVEKRAQEKTTNIKSIKKAKKIGRDIITTHILLISYHFCLYNSVHKILIIS